MTFREYTANSRQFIVYEEGASLLTDAGQPYPFPPHLMYVGLQLANEYIEYLEAKRSGGDEYSELGDLWWYAARLCEFFGTDPDIVGGSDAPLMECVKKVSSKIAKSYRARTPLLLEGDVVQLVRAIVDACAEGGHDVEGIWTANLLKLGKRKADGTIQTR
jgi:hypothetical protein